LLGSLRQPTPRRSELLMRCCGAVVLWCCGAVGLWGCGAVVLWCCGAVVGLFNMVLATIAIIATSALPSVPLQFFPSLLRSYSSRVCP